jgi:integrase
MATVEKRTRNGKVSYRVRYRAPDGTQKSKSFKRSVDARDYLKSIDHSLMVGTYVDPARSKVAVKVWAAEWLGGQEHLKASTYARYDSIISKHILPRWGTTPLAQVSHADVQKWISLIDLASASLRYIHRVFSLMLELAVRDGRLAKNPAAGVKLPRAAKPEKRYLQLPQLLHLADAAAQDPIPEVGAQYRVLILVLGYCGLRWGEAAALRIKRVDLMRRRITVAESVTEVRGRLEWGTPKNHQVRSVPIPKSLVDMLAEVIAGKRQDDLVWTTWRGATLRNLNFCRDVSTRPQRMPVLAG